MSMEWPKLVVAYDDTSSMAQQHHTSASKEGHGQTPASTRPADFYTQLVGLQSPPDTRWHQTDPLPQSEAAAPIVYAGAPAFKSSGVHQLSEYKPPPAPRLHQHQQHTRRPPHTSTQAPSQPVAASRHPSISHDNVGYQLLRRAGWEEGSGLGASEQGRTAPVEAHHQKGHRGIGFDSQAAQEAAHRKQVQQAQEAKEAAKALVKKRSRVDDIVDAELKSEDLETKVKMHRQRMQQAADDDRRKAIQRYVFKAFNDPYDLLNSADSNPLGRAHRLTASNPLLDYDYG